jgi:Carboxypeptidase regulatory-like domain
MTRHFAARRFSRPASIVALMASAMISPVVRAQEVVPAQTARLNGRMVDSTGRPIPGVRLRLVGTTRDAQSDSAGRFMLDSLAPGIVTVSFVHPVFVALTLDLPLVAGDTATVPVILVAHDSPPGVSLESGMLFGVVTDRNGRALSGAQILVATTGQSIYSDSLGRFVLRGLAPMAHLLRVRKLGFYAQYLKANATEGGALRASISMEAMGATLAEVVVRADRIHPRLRAFHTRMANNGWGQFVTRAQILERGWFSTTDVLAHMRGVSIGADLQGRPIPVTGACPMRMLLDGLPLELDGASLDTLVTVQDLAGVEVYRSGEGAPLEYTYGSPRSVGCGMVVLWTR